ncbi:MAG: hypothetical protein A2Z37_08785 [Chloroflexi bacterium RBG_19FT_COMBO_62_14]|nr:MAG: hypothetical protein A2Z37_08785 [Chloroflexi bacterium RBG_19FT_COMBO_62_14]
MGTSKGKVAWFLWPFVALWRLLALIIGFTGRVIAIVLGLVVMILGLLATLTFVGAVVGIPLMIFGFLLVVRGIF